MGHDYVPTIYNRLYRVPSGSLSLYRGPLTRRRGGQKNSYGIRGKSLEQISTPSGHAAVEDTNYYRGYEIAPLLLTTLMHYKCVPSNIIDS